MQTATTGTSATVQWTAPAAYDDSGFVRLVMQTHSSGNSFPDGTTPVEFRFEDVGGKIAQCVFNVVVSPAGYSQFLYLGIS